MWRYSSSFGGKQPNRLLDELPFSHVYKFKKKNKDSVVEWPLNCGPSTWNFDWQHTVQMCFALEHKNAQCAAESIWRFDFLQSATLRVADYWLVYDSWWSSYLDGIEKFHHQVEWTIHLGSLFHWHQQHRILELELFPLMVQAPRIRGCRCHCYLFYFL